MDMFVSHTASDTGSLPTFFTNAFVFTTNERNESATTFTLKPWHGERKQRDVILTVISMLLKSQRNYIKHIYSYKKILIKNLREIKSIKSFNNNRYII